MKKRKTQEEYVKELADTFFTMSPKYRTRKNLERILDTAFSRGVSEGITTMADSINAPYKDLM